VNIMSNITKELADALREAIAETSGVGRDVELARTHSHWRALLQLVDAPEHVAQAQRDAAVLHMAPELREALDNVTASLETCMAHFAARMPAEDAASRERRITEARDVLQRVDALLWSK
jgi:hypothetical protein